MSKGQLEVLKGLEHNPDEEQLRELRVFSLVKKRLMENLIALYDCVQGDCGQVEKSLLLHNK